jgi:CBS domain containing-hemolysin-like protein
MTILLFLFLLFLILISAFLSGSETALFSLSPLSLRIYHSSANLKQRIVAHLMERPRDLLVTILILNVLANILIQNTVSTVFDQFPNWSLKVGVPFALTLIFGEVLPKSIALPYNSVIAPRVVTPISFLMRLLTPVRKLFTSIASFSSRMIFFFLREEKAPSANELRHIVKISIESGVLSSSEADLINGALDLKEATVKELMRPRDEMLFYNLDDPLSTLNSLFVFQHLSRIPVCKGDIDHLLGILSSDQFFLHQETILESRDLIKILKKAYFVPESTRGWSLLQILREHDESMAIVVDEYGSISGLITQEDLIETIVGEISDLRSENSFFTRSGPDVIIASGKLELSQFEEIYGIPLQSENAVTLGGWLIEQLGDIPAAGVNYATDDFLFYVLAADPNRIRRIYVRRIKSSRQKK